MTDPRLLDLAHWFSSEGQPPAGRIHIDDQRDALHSLAYRMAKAGADPVAIRAAQAALRAAVRKHNRRFRPWKDERTVFHLYLDRFGEWPAMAWKGRPLSLDELFDGDPPPPGACW